MASRPEVFWLLLILLPMIVIMFKRYFAGREDLEAVSGKWRPHDFYDLYIVKSFFSSFGMIVFVVFTILSLAGFPGKETPVSYEPSGTDVVFVVDISESMKAQDISPSRLGAASRIIKSVCENSPGGRFGLIVFKGVGIKMIPSTEDVETVYNFLNFLSTDLLTSPGSNVQAGLEAALEAFPDAEERDKYIILISDGEALSGNMNDVAVKALDAGVAIYSIGTGTTDGAQIPDGDNVYLKDSSGNVVITKLEEQSLRNLSEISEGEYYSSSDNMLLPNLIDLVSGTVDKTDDRYKIIIRENYRFFLVVALFGLFIYRATKVIRWKKYF